MLSFFSLFGLDSLDITGRAEGAVPVGLTNIIGLAQQLSSGWICGFTDNGVDALSEQFVRNLKSSAGHPVEPRSYLGAGSVATIYTFIV